MGNSSSVLNGYRAQLSKKGKGLLDECVESCKGLTEEEATDILRKRVDELLVTDRLPDILMIKFQDFVNLGTFPRCPDNRDLTCTLQSIDRSNSLLIFISHCWMRGWCGAEGWDGRPHPDNAAGDKFKLCVSGIQKLWTDMAPAMKNCYIWLDFGCINQDGNPAGELEQLDKIVECCDAIFTPIVDLQHDAWEFPPVITNFFDQYQAKLWNDGPYAYLNRGWCRVEMLYAANIPILANDASSAPRHTMFESGLALHTAENRRPHFIYGTKELDRRAPYILPPLQHSYLTDYHPLKGNLSVAADIEHIRQLIAELQPYIDAHTVKDGYEGERNQQGQRHGIGVMRYANGDVYEGVFENDALNGWGKMRFANGEVYEGELKNNKFEGRGTLISADGNSYEGEWKCDKQCGYGTYRFKSGNMYEGQWKDGMYEGRGVYQYVTDGNMYEGEWLRDKKHGHGVYRYANGDVFDGEWRNGVREGHGVYRCAADGEVHEGDWKDDEFVGYSKLDTLRVSDT